MTPLRRSLVLLTVAASALLGPASPTAWATPGTGVEARTISQATVDGVDYITREITIAPGGSTGWHYHDGQVFGLIRSGTLSHDAATCASDGVYPAGAPITEDSGPEHVHVGRNLGPAPVVMWVLYIKPAGTPLAEDAPDPGCGFA